MIEGGIALENVIAVKGLKVCYGDFIAVEDLSFEVRTGEIFVIIGPNGSGKSSAVESIEGLRKCAAGDIRVLGLSPYEQRNEMYRHIGVQLQEVQYPDKMKVKELCALFASFYEAPADWQSLLQQLGLRRKGSSYVSKLSGGEKQRLSILLALLPGPEVLILDELTTGLDPEARRMLWNHLKEVRASGVSILLVSHYMEEVAYLADRLLFMRGGKAIFTGSVDQLHEYAQVELRGQYQDGMSLEDIYLLLVAECVY